MEESLTRLVNDESQFYFATSPGKVNRLVSQGWEITASGFDSYLGDSASPVFHLFNKDSGQHFWGLESKKTRRLEGKGWVNKGTTFDASDKKGKGLDPIYQLKNKSTGDLTWLSDKNLVKERVEAGWKNQGIAWFAPANNGEIEITSSDYDPITGNLKLSYSLDDLHLSQFRNYGNELTFRLAGSTTEDGKYIAADADRRDIDYNGKDKITGKINMSVANALEVNPAKLKRLHFSLNSRYGQDPSNTDGNFGFVRSKSINLLSKKHKSDTSSNLADIKYENLYGRSQSASIELQGQSLNSQSRDSRTSLGNDDVTPEPGKYYKEVNVIGRDLKAADWSHVTFSASNVKGNNLEGANLTSMESDWGTPVVPASEAIWIPSFFENNNMRSANLTDARFHIANHGWSSEFAGDITYGDTRHYQLDASDMNGGLISYESTRIIVTNKSSSEVRAKLSSPQFKYDENSIYNEQGFQVAGYSQGDSKDVKGVISKGGESITISADNHAFPREASIYIDGEERDDDGVYKFLSWEFSDSLGMKSWSVRIH